MVCEHKDLIKIRDVEPGSKGCEECLKSGDRWVRLRICLICGHVGGCDMSINKHATKHFKEIGNPIIQFFQLEEDWKYCYLDGKSLE